MTAFIEFINSLISTVGNWITNIFIVGIVSFLHSSVIWWVVKTMATMVPSVQPVSFVVLYHVTFLALYLIYVVVTFAKFSKTTA